MKNISILTLSIIVSILILVNFYFRNLLLAVIILILCIYNLIRWIKLKNKRS
uniref:FeoB-associated Cys-rich membrane protein n=1 Tax=Myoviridae sp. ctEBR14 TaxID=2825060 RepID=A0A8S5NXG1_9CAUD|nr:MAG TPA: FeoB-associated Cys-rich membrane protein [Myoviridae sp. ctEBR14]DAJ23833.1 MAG TPA: FeoB-associated Cys-rich membrane protein [Caudoviricetes sp.]DAN26543.1 MAG TPA: FeoB-associated Cys-rich membrane protein [Caudoviricetes sp.]DAP25883.1 MAG TPA: FeoB-associated Cys-rich membrane protein [Caudoviricetes sp.]DAP51895.1 MAG TPA: FeoB-associated Cys-rich membrane protein [Caudoviricetes sp.]